MKILSVLAMLTLIALNANGQKTTKNNFTGSWTNNNTWTTPPALGTTGLGNPSIVVNGYVTVGSPSGTTDLSFVGPATNSITVSDTLVIFGNMNFATDAVTLIVPAGGLLIIFGDLDVNNKVDLSSNGNIIVKGQFKLTGAQADVTGTGRFFATSYNTGASGEVPNSQEFNAGADLQAALPAVYNFITNPTANPLPVELTSFTANSTDEFVLLNWSTATQLNFSHFELQHSLNAEVWSSIATIQGEGTTNELKEYSFEHTYPHNGRNYYRLRMVDLDETFEYSPIEFVSTHVKNTFTISPNPAKGGVVRYEINFTPSEGDVLYVYDLMGGFVLSSMVTSFNQEIVLPNSLARGTYLVRYKGQASNNVVRLVVN